MILIGIMFGKTGEYYQTLTGLGVIGAVNLILRILLLGIVSTREFYGKKK